MLPSITPLGLAAPTVNPAYVTATPDGRFLYAVNWQTTLCSACYQELARLGTLAPADQRGHPRAPHVDQPQQGGLSFHQSALARGGGL